MKTLQDVVNEKKKIAAQKKAYANANKAHLAYFAAIHKKTSNLKILSTL